MSSPMFAARSPGVCALSGESFGKGESVFYMTVKGNSARPLGPSFQCERSSKDDGYSTGFRTVPNGTITTGHGRFRRTKTQFAWEELCNGRWTRVVVWEQLVLVSAARAAGYKTPGTETDARKGKRSVGYAHTVETPVAPVAPVASDDDVIDTTGTIVPETTALVVVEPTIEDMAKAFASWGS